MRESVKSKNSMKKRLVECPLGRNIGLWREVRRDAPDDNCEDRLPNLWSRKPGKMPARRVRLEA